jgi:hypothetical protein
MSGEGRIDEEAKLAAAQIWPDSIGNEKMREEMAELITAAYAEKMELLNTLSRKQRDDCGCESETFRKCALCERAERVLGGKG